MGEGEERRERVTTCETERALLFAFESSLRPSFLRSFGREERCRENARFDSLYESGQVGCVSVDGTLYKAKVSCPRR